MFSAERPAEILKWLSTYSSMAAKEGFEPVTHFIAIDDRELTQELGGRHLRGHFVLTKLRQGLTTERADVAVKLLNENPIPVDFTDQILVGNDRKVITCSRACPAATFLGQWWRPPRSVQDRPEEAHEAAAVAISLEGRGTPVLPEIQPNALPHVRQGPRGAAMNGTQRSPAMLYAAGNSTHPGARPHGEEVSREDSARKLWVPHPYKTTRSTAKTRFAVATSRGHQALADAGRLLDGVRMRPG